MNILKMQKKFMEINTIIQKQYSNQQKIKLLLLVKNMEILNKKRIVIQLAQVAQSVQFIKNIQHFKLDGQNFYQNLKIFKLNMQKTLVSFQFQIQDIKLMVIVKKLTLFMNFMEQYIMETPDVVIQQIVIILVKIMVNYMREQYNEKNKLEIWVIIWLLCGNMIGTK